NINNIPMSVGMLHFNSSTTIKTTMSGWKSGTTDVVGGFLWVYNDNDFNLKTYAAAITGVFGGGDVANVDKMKPYMTAYSGIDFTGTAANFEKGNYNIASITAQGLLDKSVSSIKLVPGFKVRLYKKNNYIGTPLTIIENTSSLVELGCNDSISSWVVRPNGDITLGGEIVYLKNKKTDLFLGVADGSISDGSNIQQQVYTGTEAQKWSLYHIGDGVYRISNNNSKLPIQVRSNSIDNGAVVEQSPFNGQDNQKMIIQQSVNVGYYKIIPYHSTKYLKTETDSVDANIIQDSIGTDNESDWELVIAHQTAIDENHAHNFVRVYPNPVNDYLIVENGNSLILKIIIVDLEGRSRQMKDNNNRIDVSTLVPGMYFANVYVDGNSTPFVMKFIKLK
ncbi:MAG: RICIN domain-containing protein, partial [Paludibacter sp.]